jgi:undecaprenyl-diphosphatase
VPVGITGLALEHTFRTLFAKPEAAAVFLTINGLILFAGEALRRQGDARRRDAADGRSTASGSGGLVVTERRTLDTIPYRDAGVIGVFQTLALLAGISRSGITMVGGLIRGLDHEDAAKFSFLLATPVILAAGLYKLPSLAGHAGDHIRGQVVVGAIVAGVAAYFTTRFLLRFFERRTLTPFAVYSVAMGVFCMIWFA